MVSPNPVIPIVPTMFAPSGVPSVLLDGPLWRFDDEEADLLE